MSEGDERAAWLKGPDFLATMPNVLLRAARLHSRQVLITGGDRQLTYAEAFEESSRFAEVLLRSGVGKGTRVGLLLPNDAEWLISFFAITRIGALAVLVPTMYQRRELEYVLRHADIHTLITREKFLSHDYMGRLQSIAPALAKTAAGSLIFVPELPHLRQVFVWGGDAPKWARNAELETDAANQAHLGPLLGLIEEQVFPSDLAFTMYTSGSTADPKAVVHTHGALVSRTHIVRGSYCFSEEDRILILGPFCWIARFMSMMLAVHAGATLICPRSPRIDDVIEAMMREEPTHIAGVPTLLRDLRLHPKVANRELGAKVLLALERKDQDGRPVSPERITLGLGMTETVGPHTLEIRGILAAGRVGAYGRAAPDIEQQIRDPETGALLRHDQIGELWLRGPHMLDSYYKKERWQVFDRDGFFATDDFCSIDEAGWLRFFGRRSEMIKVSGANVSPRELEVLLESYPEVEEAGVFGMPDGDDNEIVTAVIVTSGGSATDAEAIKERMRTDVSSFKIPRVVHIRRFEDLPRTGSGKLDKRKVRDELIALELSASA